MKRKIFLIMILVSSLLLCAWFARPAYFTKIAGNNEVYSVSTKVTNSVYDIETQKRVQSEITNLKNKNTYTESNMLLIQNPYGTNTQSMYVYFTTTTAMSVSYTIHVDDETIPDFTNTLPTNNSYSMEHEYQLLGLIPDMKNTITFHLMDKEGNKTDVSYEYSMGSLLGSEEILLEKEQGTSTQEVSEGLYVILGNDSTEKDFMYYYDNNGILRSEVPIANYRSHRLLFKDNKMYFSYDTNKIAEMDNLGQITNIFDLGKYNLHHDYVFDDNDNILILATDTTTNTVEDMIVRLNITTNEVTLVSDLGTLFPTYKEKCATYVSEDMDWMHINTIQSMGDGEILLSSRETSTIIKLSNIYDTPTVEYMMGERTFWDSTDYASLLLSKDGSFTSQAGQHSITYVEDDSLEDGQYYLYMFNNNFGTSITNPNYDWKQIAGVGDTNSTNINSKYYKYLVDENEHTYALVDSFDVPYSPYISSAQDTETTTIIDSGKQLTFLEYDKNHTLIQSYKMKGEKFIYRVYKYTFDGFYF